MLAFGVSRAGCTARSPSPIAPSPIAVRIARGAISDSEGWGGGQARAGVVHGLAVGALLPGGGGELQGVERRRWRHKAVGVEQRLDVVVQVVDQCAVVERVEPEGAAVEQQQRHVGQGAGAEAAADREVDEIAQPAPLPLLVVEAGGHGGEAILHAPAAAAVLADEELAARPRHVHRPAVGALHDVAAALVHGDQPAATAAGAAISATPISASRETSGNSSASSSPSVPAGRMGSTM